MGFVCRTLGCGLDARDLISQVHSGDIHAQVGRIGILTSQCLNCRCSGCSLDGASGSTITRVYDTSFARSSPSPVLSAFAKGRFIGVITTSGSSRVSSLSKVLPVATSHPVGYTMEKKRVGVKFEGITSGMMSSRLRATTIESSGDVMERTKLEVGAGWERISSYPTLRWRSTGPQRSYPRGTILIPFSFLTIPKTIVSP